MIGLHLIHLFARMAIAAQDLEFTLLKIIDQHLVQLLRQLEYSAENVHLVLENTSTMTTSGSWLWRIGRQDDFFIYTRCEVELPQILELVIVLIHASKDVKLAVEIGGAMGGSRQWLIWAGLAHLLPVERSTIFTAVVAFIHS